MRIHLELSNAMSQLSWEKALLVKLTQQKMRPGFPEPSAVARLLPIAAAGRLVCRAAGCYGCSSSRGCGGRWEGSEMGGGEEERRRGEAQREGKEERRIVRCVVCGGVW